MFNFLKEKLKSWFKSSEEKAQAKPVEEEKKQVETPKPEKTTEKKEEKEPAEQEKKGFLARLKEKFEFKVTEEYFEGIFSELELILLENNIALEVVEKIKSDLKQELVGLKMKKEEVSDKIKQALKISIESLFEKPFDILEKIKEISKEKPAVIVFFGINGSGKTSTIAKISYLLKKNNISVLLAAGDTFRAASIEQLTEHANKLGVKIIKSKYNADPASIAFDAISHAKAHKIQAVLIDTAGRMHTKSSLLKEMEKICRVSQPDLKIFVAESITGNDAIEQAKTFNQAIGIDAIILTKADIDEKAGTTLSVSYITGKPILFLGTGQDYKDLEIFDRKRVIENLGL